MPNAEVPRFGIGPSAFGIEQGYRSFGLMFV
jgi:hypothetical protein